jgi:aspartate kinase
MRIYKFGGASVKDASGVKNLVKILNELGNDKTLVVVSAMGKMTNSLEFVVKNYFENQKELEYLLNEIFVFHNNILNELFPDNNHSIYFETKEIF